MGNKYFQLKMIMVCLYDLVLYFLLFLVGYIISFVMNSITKNLIIHGQKVYNSLKGAQDG